MAPTLVNCLPPVWWWAVCQSNWPSWHRWPWWPDGTAPDSLDPADLPLTPGLHTNATWTVRPAVLSDHLNCQTTYTVRQSPMLDCNVWPPVLQSHLCSQLMWSHALSGHLFCLQQCGQPNCGVRKIVRSSVSKLSNVVSCICTINWIWSDQMYCQTNSNSIIRRPILPTSFVKPIVLWDPLHC